MKEQAHFVRNDVDKRAGERFSLGHAFSCAWHGYFAAFCMQRNMKVHAFVAVLAVLLGFVLRIDMASWTAVVLCIALVFAVECLNTSVETVVDLVSPEYSELARRAKDCAAGAVLVCAVASLVVAAVVFLPRLWMLIAG